MARKEDKVELRPPGSGDPPKGWVTRPLEWFGEEWEVAYNPRRVQVLKTGPELTRDTRRRLSEVGYEEVVRDGRGGALWQIGADRLRLAQLDRLSSAEPTPDDPSLGLA